jgi:hypothetical protein
MASTAKTIITDFRHLPEIDSDEIATGRSLPAFLARIVIVASLEGPTARVRSPIRCRCRPGRRACPGVILISRHARYSEVEWRCSECEFNGMITHWEGSTADHSERAAPKVEVVTPELPPNSVSPSLLGRWRIEEMEVWDKDAIDLLCPGYIEFAKRHGSMRFVAIEGGLDCRYSDAEGQPMVEFSWFGGDDRDDASGRGWARLQVDGSLVGRIFKHCGDDSSFTARRFDSTPAPRSPRRGRLQ